MKTKILGIIVLAVMVAAVVLSGCAPAPAPTPAPKPTPAPAPAKVYEWKIQSFCPTGMERYQVDIATQLPKMVSDATNGQIKITAYPAGALVPVPDMLSATRDNVIQMTHSVGSHWAGVIPVGNVEFSMPMAYQTCEDAWTVMWDRGLQDLLEKPYNEKGVHYLGFQPPMGNRLMTSKAIRTFNDFKGLKVRALGTFATFAEKLGMSPVNIPMTELYMALKLGTVDGSITGMDVHFDQKQHEIEKFLTLPKFSFAEPLNILVNLKEWNALPDDLKKKASSALVEWSKWAGNVVEPPRIKKVEDGFKAAGVEFVQLSPDDSLKVQMLAVEVWDDWAKKDDYSAKAVAILKAYAKEKGRIK